MKKKIAYIVLVAVISMTAFYIGRNTSQHNKIDCINSFLDSITDWNTDGKELAIMTDNGYEFYTEKQSPEYKPERKQYIGFPEFSTWETQGNTLYITTTDGNIYSFNR